MWERIGLGPVFVYESLLNARRPQVYAARVVFVGLLLVGITFVWVDSDIKGTGPGGSPTLQELAEVGEGFFYALTALQLSLVLLMAPAATAGSIGVDRARGTLLHLMVTDLSDTEVVLGKLGARLGPVLGMIACGLPVTALAGLLGGIDFGALAGVLAVTVAVAVLGCSMALALSVRSGKTHEVLLAIYLVEFLYLMVVPFWWTFQRSNKVPGPPGWVEMTHPYVLAFAPYAEPGSADVWTYVAFVAGALGIAAALVLVSILTFRPVVVADGGRPQRAARRRLAGLTRLLPTFAGPKLDGNPVLWREWHRNRPSRLARGVWATLLTLTWGLAAWGGVEILSGVSIQESAGFNLALMIQVAFGLLMVAASAPTALAEERVRGTLDVLLTTPLSTRSIVAAKWWGAYRRVLWLLPLPLLATVLVAAIANPTAPRQLGSRYDLVLGDRLIAPILTVADLLASGALIVGIGLALATWVRRLGRAIALSVMAYLALGIGWLFVAERLVRCVVGPNASGNGSEDHRWMVESVMAFSPIYGPLLPLDLLGSFRVVPRRLTWVGAAAMVMLKLALTWGLFVLTVRTFDRCLGRVSERPRRRPQPRREPVEELAPGLA